MQYAGALRCIDGRDPMRHHRDSDRMSRIMMLILDLLALYKSAERQILRCRVSRMRIQPSTTLCISLLKAHRDYNLSWIVLQSSRNQNSD